MSQPEPEVWARPAEAAEIPRGARAVVKAAEAAGWDVRVTYARGTWPFPKKPPAVVDSVLLRMAHADGRRAAAHWIDGGFDDAYIWNASTVYLRKVGANNLKHALAEVEWPKPDPIMDKPTRGEPPALLARPRVAGSWGTVHAGDVVRGADQRPWTVLERGPALRWAIGGDSADFTMSNTDRGEVTVRRKLSDPCDVMMRLNHSEMAEAVGALVAGGMGVDILRESTALAPGRRCVVGHPLVLDPEDRCATCLAVATIDNAIESGTAAAWAPGERERLAADTTAMTAEDAWTAEQQRRVEAGCCGGWSGPGGMPEDCGTRCPLSKSYVAEALAPKRPLDNGFRAPEVVAEMEREAARAALDSAVERAAERPCDDPFCGPGGCGWAASAHIKPAATTPKERTRTTVTDPFETPTSTKDPLKNGRYHLPDPITGEPTSYQRVTNLVKLLADTFGIERWEKRLITKGVALRPDLVTLAAALDLDEDKKALDGVAKQAKEFAKAKAGANMGTALHKFTDRIDRGEPLESLGASGPVLADLRAYVAIKRAARLTTVPEYMERIVVVPQLGVAGRLDRLDRMSDGRLTVEDLKTGKDLDYSWLEIAVQEACYANATHMWNAEREAYDPMPTNLDRERGLVTWLPVGQKTAHVYGVDLIKGWQWAQLAVKVREARAEAGRGVSWLVAPTDQATHAVHLVSRAGSQQELAELWESFNRRNLWTPEVDSAAHARMAQLQPTV